MCKGLLECPRQELNHSGKEGIDEKQFGLAHLGKLPQGHGHFSILKVSISDSLSSPVTRVIPVELTFLEACFYAFQPPPSSRESGGNIFGGKLFLSPASPVQMHGDPLHLAATVLPLPH